ncbi:Brp/Blh family beta-carotene 15,15'-dioxygenase [Robiginitalea sp. IMCC44478]|uniref:Brp/Blh family beta-carotene 15,15'-dioxygenase n=1 Tax=Robiginitalea sp. IMCC44478 TaxID=3459122 RepID=UPI004043294C
MLRIADLRNGMIVLTFFFLWVSIFFSDQVEEWLAFILIFSFGIVHGANDIHILRSEKGSRRLLPPYGIILLYIGFVLICALLFYILPIAALLFFILFSAYHFGEQHWIDRPLRKGPLRKLTFFSYGMVVLNTLFMAHSEQVTQVINEIANYQLSGQLFGWVALLFLGLFLIALLFSIEWKKLLKFLPFELFLLAVFFIVFHTASLIWAFAIYFILWHSIPSLADQIKKLYGKINLNAALKYLRTSAIYWVAALVTLAAAFLYFRDSESEFLPLFFSFLAAITFPHVLVISRLYQD